MTPRGFTEIPDERAIPNFTFQRVVEDWRVNSNTMKTPITAAFALSFFGALIPASAATESYQVTGPVVEVTEAKIVVQKDKEKWEVARTGDTKTTGQPKVGDKVTVHYTMTAASIEVKADKADKEAKPATPAVPAKPAKPAAAPAKTDKKP